MASVYVTFGATHLDTGRQPKEIFIGDTVRSEVITSSGTSAAGSLTAGRFETAVIRCATAVYACSAATPVAAAATAVYVPAGESVPLAVKYGQKIAVIDV